MKRLSVFLLLMLLLLSFVASTRASRVSAQVYQTKAILRPQADSHIIIEDTGSNGTITFTTDGVARMIVDAAGNVGIGTSPTAKLDVNGAVKATDLETQVGSHIHVYLSQCGGLCSSYHSLNNWIDVASYNYSWGVNMNTDPSLFSHDGKGRITINQAGSYYIRISTMAVPTGDAVVNVYGCPIINGSAGCGGASGVNGRLHGYYPGGWWAKGRNEFVYFLGEGATVGYGYLTTYALNSWAHDWYTAVEITKLK